MAPILFLFIFFLRVYTHLFFLRRKNSAQVFATDLFESAFAADPRSRLAWKKYRKGILAYGGSRDELQILHEFLGRPPNPAALLGSMNLEEKV